jgi:hypothetical protein
MLSWVRPAPGWLAFVGRGEADLTGIKAALLPSCTNREK